MELKKKIDNQIKKKKKNQALWNFAMKLNIRHFIRQIPDQISRQLSYRPASMTHCSLQRRPSVISHSQQQNLPTQHCGDILNVGNSLGNTLPPFPEEISIAHTRHCKITAYYPVGKHRAWRRQIDARPFLRHVQSYASGSVERVKRKHVAPRENRQVWGTKISTSSCGPSARPAVAFRSLLLGNLLRRSCRFALKCI